MSNLNQCFCLHRNFHILYDANFPFRLHDNMGYRGNMKFKGNVRDSRGKLHFQCRGNLGISSTRLR